MKISIARLQAFFLRHLYPLRRDFDLLSDMIYWPMVDTALWGITGMWLVETSGNAQLVVSVLLGLVLWNVLWRSQSEVARNLMDEIWNNNLVNLFSTPLSTKEWVVGVLLLSVLKTLFTVGLLIPVIFFLYSVNVFQIGWWLIPFFVGCAMTGWWIGFVSAGIVLQNGPKVQSIIWTLPGILIPFSAVFFPLEQLPEVLRPISYALPTTYVLESMRTQVFAGYVDLWFLGKGFVLNIVYLCLSLWFFMRSFEISRERGLGRFN